MHSYAHSHTHTPLQRLCIGKVTIVYRSKVQQMCVAFHLRCLSHNADQTMDVRMRGMSQQGRLSSVLVANCDVTAVANVINFPRVCSTVATVTLSPPQR